MDVRSYIARRLHREIRTKIVVAGDERKVGGGSRSRVLLGEPFTPTLPGLTLALGVLFEESGVIRRHVDGS